MEAQLLEYLNNNLGSEERVGFILETGEIVEVKNICLEPEEGFEVSGQDLIKYTPNAKATWHTHPASTALLSANDWQSFLNYSNLDHYIIGTDGVKKYVVKNGMVINA